MCSNALVVARPLPVARERIFFLESRDDKARALVILTTIRRWAYVACAGRCAPRTSGAMRHSSYIHSAHEGSHGAREPATARVLPMPCFEHTSKKEP